MTRNHKRAAMKKETKLLLLLLSFGAASSLVATEDCRPRRGNRQKQVQMVPNGNKHQNPKMKISKNCGTKRADKHEDQDETLDEQSVKVGKKHRRSNHSPAKKVYNQQFLDDEGFDTFQEFEEAPGLDEMMPVKLESPFVLKAPTQLIPLNNLCLDTSNQSVELEYWKKDKLAECFENGVTAKIGRNDLQNISGLKKCAIISQGCNEAIVITNLFDPDSNSLASVKPRSALNRHYFPILVAPAFMSQMKEFIFAENQQAQGRAIQPLNTPGIGSDSTTWSFEKKVVIGVSVSVVLYGIYNVMTESIVHNHKVELGNLENERLDKVNEGKKIDFDTANVTAEAQKFHDQKKFEIKQLDFNETEKKLDYKANNTGKVIFKEVRKTSGNVAKIVGYIVSPFSALFDSVANLAGNCIRAWRGKE